MNIILDKPDNCKVDIIFFESIVTEISDFVEFNIDAELSVVLTDDEDIRQINNEFRQIDKATDVLSFPMEETDILGDIVISLDTTMRQAADAEIKFERELAFLFIHGFLHLLGFDHETSVEDEKEMFELQEDILKQWVSKYE